MKKFLIIVTIIILLLGVVVYLNQDNPEDFSGYKNYVEKLQSFETQNGTMRYFDKGEGQVILLVHGVPTSSWMYRNLADELVTNGYRVIAPDLMGFGASDRMDEYDMYDFDEQAETIFSLMDFLGITEWEQVTHDMGGLVTWNMARIAPEKISHLYILNTIIYKDTFNPPADFDYENKIHKFILNLHANPIIGKIIVNNMLRTGTNKYLFSNSDKAGYWLPLRKGAGALVHFFTHTTEIKENLDEYRSWLINSNIPTSVIWGENDPFLGSESVERLKQELDLLDDEILILEDKKHLIAEEAYQEIAEFIINKRQD